MYKILLVEDDEKICDVIQEYFQNQIVLDLHLTIEMNGNAAMDLLYENAYDLVLLDVMLPGASGFEICKEIRKNQDTPIIFITARGSEEDVLYGYDLGCDDYIVKPFSLAMLVAKMKALLNRSKGTVIEEIIRCGELGLHPHKMQVFIGEEEISLPLKEYMLLKILLENKNQVVTRDSIIVRIWGYDYDGDDRVLDNHMKKLRKALGDYGKNIKTVIGKGYKIVE